MPLGWALRSEDEALVAFVHPASQVNVYIVRRSNLRRPPAELHVDGTVENALVGAAPFRGTVAARAGSLPGVVTAPGPPVMVLGRQVTSTIARWDDAGAPPDRCTADAPCPFVFVMTPSAIPFVISNAYAAVFLELSAANIVIEVDVEGQFSMAKWQTVVTPLLKSLRMA